jgi:hypothetical protein
MFLRGLANDSVLIEEGRVLGAMIWRLRLIKLLMRLLQGIIEIGLWSFILWDVGVFGV